MESTKWYPYLDSVKFHLGVLGEEFISSTPLRRSRHILSLNSSLESNFD